MYKFFYKNKLANVGLVFVGLGFFFGAYTEALGGFFLLAFAFLVSISISFKNISRFKIEEVSHFIWLLFLAVSVFQELIKHSTGLEYFKYLRDILFVVLLMYMFFMYFTSILRYMVFSKFQSVIILIVGAVGVLFSSSFIYSLWSFRDGYMYAILALMIVPISSEQLLRKVSILVVYLGVINICIGGYQQLNHAGSWLAIGYGDIALSEWHGVRRPWGTFDRSLTYGHFMLIASVLSMYVMRSKSLGVLFLLAALLAFNRSVLVGAVLVFSLMVFYEQGIVKKILAGFFVISIGFAVLPIIETVLFSIFDADFKSNNERVNDYMSILSMGFSELLYGGYLGLVGANAGRFNIELEFVTGVAHIHSGYLTILLEVGWLGLIAYLYNVAWWGAKAYFRTVNVMTKTIVLNMFAIFSVSMVTHNMQSNIPNSILFWVLLGLLAGMNSRKIYVYNR